MKYKLTKEAIEELKAMEFEENGQTTYEIISDCIEKLYDGWISTQGFELFQIVAEKLPKPVLKSIEDFVALKGWEYQWEHTAHWVWWSPKTTPCNSLEELYTAKIRQIDMPENTYLVKDCIEQEIEVGDIAKHEGGFIGLVQSIWGSDLVEVELGNKTDEYCYNLNHCKLIRKASEITAEDREKYLGEKQAEAKEPISLADYQAHKDREFEAKVREILVRVLEERGL